MRLELGTFPVDDVVFGSRTRWTDGRLEIDADRVLAAVRRDPRIEKAELELAKPGESARIWPVRDVIEPRVKVEGPGVVYPGVCGRPVDTVGRGRTHRLSGVGVVEVSNVNWHEAGGDYVDLFLDMSGPWAEMIPQSKLQNVCLLVEPDPGLHIEIKNEAVHNAALVVSDCLAEATRGMKAPRERVYELGSEHPDLPGVIYIQCLHSPQAMSQSDKTFCTATYGLTRLTTPWMLHPNEILDGAINGPYRTAFATSWTVANNPVVQELYDRHGKDLNFKGVLAYRTEWTTQWEKELMAQQAAKMVQMTGARGVIVTWDAGGNEFMEVVYAVRACERLGIKTVFMTSEDTPQGGEPTMLEPIPEADAIVTTGYIATDEMGLGPVPPVKRLIGNPIKQFGKMWMGAIPQQGPVNTVESIHPPGRYDDHYGFNHYRTFVY
jgi:glycine reductase complex component B subunit alpha and beta